MASVGLPELTVEEMGVPTADNPGLKRCAELARTPVGNYHYGELKIALDPASPSHYLPVVPAGAKVLDIGCGAGQTLIAACPYRVPGEGGLCLPCSRNDCPEWGYGVDIDEEALALGRAWSRRMVFSLGSADRLPYNDQEFDLVISRVALPYVDMQRAIAEIRRVLRPGGRIWIALHPFRTIFLHWRQRNWKGWCFAGYVALNGLFFHLTLRTFSLLYRREYWQSESATRRVLTKAGFVNIQREPGPPNRLSISAELPESVPGAVR